MIVLIDACLKPSAPRLPLPHSCRQPQASDGHACKQIPLTQDQRDSTDASNAEQSRNGSCSSGQRDALGVEFWPVSDLTDSGCLSFDQAPWTVDTALVDLEAASLTDLLAELEPMPLHDCGELAPLEDAFAAAPPDQPGRATESPAEVPGDPAATLSQAQEVSACQHSHSHSHAVPQSPRPMPSSQPAAVAAGSQDLPEPAPEPKVKTSKRVRKKVDPNAPKRPRGRPRKQQVDAAAVAAARPKAEACLWNTINPENMYSLGIADLLA